MLCNTGKPQHSLTDQHVADEVTSPHVGTSTVLYPTKTNYGICSFGAISSIKVSEEKPV